ncbi:tripartite motif-containing protein 16-like isoform X1 [Acanthopagrus latus]|uniref:tripartite motif-containing protein 16-like isoform X1 n=1 Tax=Acanthopagrus latus TaxID=8177 RepID=UPI00187C7041|nr:tripartite motif-containing protein 16-like isoform X1 [Acanthopagrus latus]
MAQQRNQADKLKFSCSICLDLLKDPVTIPCGHNYCMKCIKDTWGKEDQEKTHSCPQCRRSFTPRPELLKNTLLAELVEELKKTGLQDAPADLCYAGAEDVACDVCTGRKLRAAKSCLLCQISYCEQHLQPHLQSPAFKKHKLVEPSVKLQENICSRHDEVIKIFCRTDQKCICLVCSMDDHKGHDTVSAATERAEKQKQLDQSRQDVQQRIQDREKDVKQLQQEVETTTRSADEAVEHSEKIFTQLIRLVETRRSDVKQRIRSQQELDVSLAKERQEKLNQEITELKKKDAELEKLSLTEDHTQFLLSYPSLSTRTESTISPRPNIDRLQFFKDMTAAVTAARDQLQLVLTEKLPLRAEFLQYSRQITLDPNTAERRLVLSAGNRKVTFNDKNPPYPDHPDRLIDRPQVLSKEGLTGRCYWEVETKKRSGTVYVSVAYKSVNRSDLFGSNKKSWSLDCYSSGYNFYHDRQKTSISGPVPSRIGVYLDHSAGILSFYSVSSDTMRLLHKVQTTFTEPLHAGLWLYCSNGDTAEVCKVKQ